MSRPKAYIVPDIRSKNRKAMWLVVEKTEKTAHPILEDEIGVIMRACKDYLKKIKMVKK